jgi:FkbM family methyltransferase
MLIDISQLKFTKDVYGIIHIGAHDCEERYKYLFKFNNITDNDIIWIDALKNKVDAIKSQHPEIRIFNECISNTDNETVIFNVTNNLQSSSFLKLKEHLHEHPDIYEVEKIEMKTKTLTTFYNENNFEYSQYNFMALDIQGAELLALKGAGDILNSIDYIYIEVNTKELYENCGLLEDVEDYLGKFNFRRQTIYMTEHGWGDAFYVKSVFNISTNYTIQYGIDNHMVDITDKVLSKQTNNFGTVYIPEGDGYRAFLFGDPLHSIIKKIFIVTSDNKKFTIDHTDYAYINTSNNKLYINETYIDKYNLAVMAIFKNETMNLRVWLEHYLWQGVEHFYLIDNGSTDNPLEILQEYIDNGTVSYYYRPEKHQQVQHYQYIFDNENLKEKTKWLCICDLDEFFFGTNKKLINALTDDFDTYDVIYTHSFFYGSDNLIDHPKDIRTSIVNRTDDVINGIKYIFKPSSINDSSEIWIHWLVHPGTLQKKPGQNETFTDTKIRLNHYIIQSLEYFKNVKMPRGDVSILENENIRTMDVFYYYEKNAIIKDDILKQIIENNIYDNSHDMKFYDENNKSVEPELLKLSSNIRIKYGTKEYNTDVTEIVFDKYNIDSVIYIPEGDGNRAKTLGDPLHGIIKSMFIYDNDINTIIEIQHNQSVCIDLSTNRLYIDNIPEKYKKQKYKLHIKNYVDGIVENEPNFKIDTINKNIYRYENVINYNYQFCAPEIIIEGIHKPLKNNPTYYVILDCSGLDSFGHWVYESFIFFPIVEELNKIYPNIKILTTNKKKYVSNLLNFVGIKNEIVYTINDYNNICFVPCLSSLNYNVNIPLLNNYIENFINKIELNIINFNYCNNILFLPRNTKENYWPDDKIPVHLLRERRNQEQIDYISDGVIKNGGVVLNTYDINNFFIQFSIVMNSKNIIVEYGSSFQVNCIACKNKNIIVLNYDKVECHKEIPPVTYLHNIIETNNNVTLLYEYNNFEDIKKYIK